MNPLTASQSYSLWVAGTARISASVRRRDDGIQPDGSDKPRLDERIARLRVIVLSVEHPSLALRLRKAEVVDDAVAPCVRHFDAQLIAPLPDETVEATAVRLTPECPQLLVISMNSYHEYGTEWMIMAFLAFLY